MDIKQSINERFLLFVEYIKNEKGLSNYELEKKLHLHKNAISNYKNPVQKRYIGIESVYWAKIVYNLNPDFILTLSDKMLTTDYPTSNVLLDSQQNTDYKILLEKIDNLEKVIRDKTAIIELQKQLLYAQNPKGQKKTKP